MKPSTKNIVQIFAGYHVVVALPLVFPITALWLLDVLNLLQGTLGLPGDMGEFNRTQLLFVNLFATLAVVWALYRFNYPTADIAGYEGWAMLAFSALVIFHVMNGTSPLLLAIPAVDLPGGFLHLWASKQKTLDP